MLCCWAVYLNKTTVKNMFQRISAFVDGKTCVPEPFQDINKAYSLLDHCSSAYFQEIQISQTLKEFLLERRDKESESGCHFTANPPSPLLLWKALALPWCIYEGLR